MYVTISPTNIFIDLFLDRTIYVVNAVIYSFRICGNCEKLSRNFCRLLFFIKKLWAYNHLWSLEWFFLKNIFSGLAVLLSKNQKTILPNIMVISELQILTCPLKTFFSIYRPISFRKCQVNRYYHFGIHSMVINTTNQKII